MPYNIDIEILGKMSDTVPRPFVFNAKFAGIPVTIPPRSTYKQDDRVSKSMHGAHGERLVTKPVDVLALPDKLSYNQETSTLRQCVRARAIYRCSTEDILLGLFIT